MSTHDHGAVGAGETFAECPFCGAVNESCKHLIACFGISDPAVTAGILTDHQDELLELMHGHPRSVGEEGDDELVDDDGYEPDIEDFVTSLRAFLEHHAEVAWADFSVDEDGDLWDYANYWARYPGMVIDDLYRYLESARQDY
jgi:hypothetical protein